MNKPAEDVEPQAKVVSSNPEVTLPQDLMNLRVEFAPFFVKLIVASFAMIALSLLAELGIIFFYQTKYQEASLAVGEKTLMLHVVRTSLGMLLGLVSLAMGVVLSWLAVEAPFKLSAKSTNGPAVSMSSVGPGIVLMIGGMILVGVSLYAPMEFKLDKHGSGSSSKIGTTLNEGPGPKGPTAPLEPQ